MEDPLTPDMIYAQGVLFFSAGFETTSNALSTFAYNLARHPEIQVWAQLIFSGPELVLAKSWEEKKSTGSLFQKVYNRIGAWINLAPRR